MNGIHNTPFSGITPTRIPSHASPSRTPSLASPSRIPSFLRRKSLGEEITGPHPNLLSLTNQHTPVSLLLSVINGDTTLGAKCDQIADLLRSLNSKDLVDVYPELLVQIFGFSGNQVFGLSQYEPVNYHSELITVYNFLSVNGCVFSVINKLLGDNAAEFHFPYKLLPAGIVEKIIGGQMSLWYQKKLIVLNSDPDYEVALSCNALEYYVLLFCLYLIHPQTLSQPSQWSAVEDVLYIRLLEDYLHYFFPISYGRNTITTNAGAAAQNSPSLWKSFSHKMDTDIGSVISHQSSPWGLLKHLAPSSHAEIVLQIFCDIWFGLNPERPLNEDDGYQLPTVDHARCVRILVKYMHTFINGINDVQAVLFSATYTDQLDEFKNIVIPVLLHKPLYLYLKHCFKHWPLDASFRMILETWLSFIQPWRYVEDNNNMSLNETLEANIAQWELFVTDNVPFYTKIFQMFLLRALRYDFTSLHDMKLIYRVSKVFSQTSLSQILHGDHVEMNRISIKPAEGSMFLGTPSNRKIQFESPSSAVPSLFSLDIRNHVHDLCKRIVTAILDVKKNRFQSSQGKNVLSIFKKLFYIDGVTGFDDCEKQQLLEYLEKSCLHLTSLYNFPEFEQVIKNSQVPENLIENANHKKNELPDFRVTENGVELTDVGRYQILNGIRQFPITYSGDPELQPLRTYECSVAVKVLYWAACRLNSKCSSFLFKLYNQSAFANMLHSVSKKLGSNHYMNTPFMLPASVSSTAEVTPRISLRFAASYYFMGCVCWLIILAKVFGFGWLLILLSLVVFTLINVVANVDSPPKKFSKED